MQAAETHARTRGFARAVDKARRVVDCALESTPDACIGWSAGKDSTVLTHLVCVDRGARGVAVYSEKDDLDFPGEEQYITALASAWQAKLTIVRPEVSLQQWVQEQPGMHPGDDIHARSAALSKIGFYSVIDRVTTTHACSMLGLRAEESGTRRHVRAAKGLYYQLVSGRWRANPIGDWKAIDVYAYAASRGIDLLPVYKCVGFLHREKPWLIRKSWWLPGRAAQYGQIAWLRRYWPSLYRLLCKWFPNARQYA